MTFKRVLIALDGSPVAAEAAGVAIDLASAVSAEVAFVYVVDPTDELAASSGVGGLPADVLLSTLRQEGRNILLAAQSRHRTEPTAWQFLREGKPATEILAAAKEWSADLIVVGSHGRSGLGRALMGSTSESVVRHAPCPVLVVRARG